MAREAAAPDPEAEAREAAAPDPEAHSLVNAMSP